SPLSRSPTRGTPGEQRPVSEGEDAEPTDLGCQSLRPPRPRFVPVDVAGVLIDRGAAEGGATGDRGDGRVSEPPARREREGHLEDPVPAGTAADPPLGTSRSVGSGVD